MSIFKKLAARGTDKKQEQEWQKTLQENKSKRSAVSLQNGVLNNISQNIMFEDDTNSNSGSSSNLKKDDGKMPSADEVNAKFEKLLVRKLIVITNF